MVLLTGSAAHGKGAGEASVLGTQAHPNHVLFDIVDGKATVALPQGGQLTLTPDRDGRLAGSGSVTDKAGTSAQHVRHPRPTRNRVSRSQPQSRCPPVTQRNPERNTRTCTQRMTMATLRGRQLRFR